MSREQTTVIGQLDRICRTLAPQAAMAATLVLELIHGETDPAVETISPITEKMSTMLDLISATSTVSLLMIRELEATISEWTHIVPVTYLAIATAAAALKEKQIQKRALCLMTTKGKNKKWLKK